MKGYSTKILVGLLLVIMILFVSLSIYIPIMSSAESFIKGCPPIASIIADASGGAVEVC